MTTETKTYQCSTCHQGFASSRALGGHMRQHSSKNGASAESDLPHQPIPVGTVTPAHDPSPVWLIRKAPHALLIPLIGPLIGATFLPVAGIVYAAGVAMFGLMFGLAAAYMMARGVIAPLYSIKALERGKNSHKAVVLTKEWVEKKQARRDMPEAKRLIEGESYWVDVQDPEHPVVFDPTIRDVPHYHLTPQQIRFAVADAPTRVTVNAKLFSVPAEALHVGASFAVVGISFFIIWAIINPG